MEFHLNPECQIEPVSPNWPSLENILPELKTVLPNADFVEVAINRP